MIDIALTAEYALYRNCEMTDAGHVVWLERRPATAAVTNL
jgi:hypothetical protein